MNATTKASLGSLLNGAAWLFFGAGGLLFWFGGGLIHAIAQTERLLAEMEGIGLAMLFGIAGAIAKGVAIRLEEVDGPVSLSESLRR